MPLHTASQQAVALVLSACLLVGSAPAAMGQSTTSTLRTQPGGDPWPRVSKGQGATISIYQPQLESWTGNLLDAYAAVTIKTQGSQAVNYGVVWFTARTEVDKVNRVVTLNDFNLTKRSFPTLANNGQAYLSAFKGAMPWNESMPLDELETALSTTSIDAQQKRVPVKNDPPRVIVSTTPALLVSIDGQPVMRPASGGLSKVINTRALVLVDASRSNYYLALMDGWVRSASLDGPWSFAADAPTGTLDAIKAAAVQSARNQIVGDATKSLSAAYADGEAPTVYVSTTPTELLLTQGQPKYAPIPGTTLSYVQNSADDIFKDDATIFVGVFESQA